jgi:HSP20 family molecular chaperone IbpA
MEIAYGRFQRIVKISLPIDTDNISAKYNEGFLQITLPKKKLKPPVVIDTSPEE